MGTLVTPADTPQLTLTTSALICHRNGDGKGAGQHGARAEDHLQRAVGIGFEEAVDCRQ